MLDPDGDVIITLRNFNAPFPILPFDETLSAWENVPQIAVGGQIVETGLPIEAAPPEVVEEVLPIEAEAPAPEAVEEDSGNIWPMEDPFVESPIPSVRLQVSSAHLRLVSPYFKKALDGPFKESHSTTDGLRHIDADDWDTEAFLIVMRIIHGQNRLVSRSLDLEMLAKVAAIVDYYQCHEMLEPFAEIWHLQRKEALIPGTVSRDLILLLFVSWVLRWSEEFKAVTRIPQTQSKGPLSTMGLPIPERIICKTTVIISLEVANSCYKLSSINRDRKLFITLASCLMICLIASVKSLQIALKHVPQCNSELLRGVYYIRRSFNFMHRGTNP